jgi:hypothetical protein
MIISNAEEITLQPVKQKYYPINKSLGEITTFNFPWEDTVVYSVCSI